MKLTLLHSFLQEFGSLYSLSNDSDLGEGKEKGLNYLYTVTLNLAIARALFTPEVERFVLSLSFITIFFSYIFL